jgi:hypothetical protein
MFGGEGQRSPETSDELAVLRLTHKQATEERDRIRAARAFFARQLGPLPAVAGISLGAVAAFSDEIRTKWLLWVALGFFALMVVASIGYSRMPPYRVLRSQRTKGPDGIADGSQARTEIEWYANEIKLEHSIYDSPTNESWFRRLWPESRPGQDLQDQMDKERFGVFLVQILFLCVIASLLAARLI